MVTANCVSVLGKESRQNRRYERELDAVAHHIPTTLRRPDTRTYTRFEPILPLSHIGAPTMHREHALRAHPGFYRTLAGGNKAVKPPHAKHVRVDGIARRNS